MEHLAVRCVRCEDDIATAVKAELILNPQPKAEGTGNQVTYNFTLDRA